MGDFQANFKRPDGGIHTVEGTVAGARAAMLEGKRQKEQAEFESKKQRVLDEHKHHISGIDGKFASARSTVSETAFRSKTVGLVTAADFKRFSKEADDESNAKEAAAIRQPTETAEEIAAKEKALKKEQKRRLKEKKKLLSTLSFAGQDDDDNDYAVAETFDMQQKQFTNSNHKLLAKDPTVDTSFLPDQQRDKQMEEERKRLEQEWKQRQSAIKKETLEIVYSYWDGTGHRRSCKCLKGDTIATFLETARKDLCSTEFRELSGVSADDLLYVKEDLILPQDLTFYDLIATKARGKSGPLFHFDVHDDLRVGALDARIEKDESHPGKVVER